MKKVKNTILIDKDTGEILEKKSISVVSHLKINFLKNKNSSSNRYICIGSKTNNLKNNHVGFLIRICNEFLHYDTTLLHRRGIGNEKVRLSISDISMVLQRNKKTVSSYLKELTRMKALIRPNSQIRYFVNPRYIIRGFTINIEEFYMLLTHDPEIIDCLDSINRRDYFNYLLFLQKG